MEKAQLDIYIEIRRNIARKNKTTLPANKIVAKYII